MSQTAHHTRIRAIQNAIRDQETVDGWLFYDFRGSDPLAYRVLLLDSSQHVTRRWYYWIPRAGEPVKLLHRIEPRVLDDLPGHSHLYVSWEQQRTALDSLLRGQRRIAMQYSPLNAVPYLSRVDAGTIELVRTFGVEVVTSAELVQRFEAVWTEEQLESHRYAVTTLRCIVDEAFTHVASCLTHHRHVTEYDLQQFILSRIHDTAMTTSSPPIAAVDAHSADPHYSPRESDSSQITFGRSELHLAPSMATSPGLVIQDTKYHQSIA
jgi:Xaa-Pro dipeptidase